MTKDEFMREAMREGRTEEQAEARWAAMDAVVEWMNQPRPQGCAMIWRRGAEPDVFKSWDLSSQDDLDYIGLFPPNEWHHYADEGGSFGCCNVEVIKLPNGWEIRYGYHS